MSDKISKAYSSFFQNFALPIYDIARGTSRFKYSRILNSCQWLPEREIELLQAKNLRTMYKHAFESVPYYNRLLKSRGLNSDSVQSVEDLQKLPILTKADLRNHYSELISRTYPRRNLLKQTSGGTGDQIRFLVTKEQLSWEISAEYRAYSWANYHIGDRCLTFWGSPIDITKQRRFVNRVAKNFERILIANTYIVTDKVLENYAETMEKFRPDIIRGYSSSVYLMAKYLNKRGLRQVLPRAVITSAESLDRFQRETIEKAFGCPVFDYYGSREVGSMAAECEKHNGYHVSAENVVMEYVKNGENVSSGEEGEIIVTNLRNFGMPFIRYAIGDVGKPSTEVCSCGRGLPLMASIEGRISQFMAVYDKQSGRVIPVSSAAPGPLSMVLMNVPIERYQIVQESLSHLTIKAVKGKGYLQKHSDYVINSLRNIFGDDLDIDFEFLDDLPPLPSGKRSVFISKIDSF